MAIVVYLVGSLGGAAFAAQWTPPLVRHPSYDDRWAMVLISGVEASPGLAEARSSARAYARRLNELGFQTVILGGVSRPEFDETLREAAADIPARAEVAVFVVGRTVSSGSDIFVTPADAAGELSSSDPAIETEALRLSSIERRILDRSPREVATVIEDCRESGAACSSSALDVLPTASAVALLGASSNAARVVVLDEMVRGGATFGQFFAAVSTKLQSIGVPARRSGHLSHSFRFVPEGFFETLPNGCAAIDPLADEVSSLDPQIATRAESCARTAASWPYVFAYRLRRSAAQEQLAYQRAVADCDRSDTAAAYAQAYPSGRYGGAVERFRQSCDKRVAPPAPRPVPPTVEANSVMPVAPVRVSPSFSCVRVSLPAERAICASGELAALDLQMARAYGRSVGGLRGPARQSIVKDQRLWLLQRNGCGASAGCIAQSYLQRIGQLR